MLILIGVLILLVAIAAAGVSVLAQRNKQAFARQNEIIVGTPSRAPAAWAGAHSPEARLHRRLRSAVDAARAQSAGPGSGLADVIAAIERGATEIDDRLIAAAALPAAHRDAAIAELEPSVASLEAAVAGLHAASAQRSPGGQPTIATDVAPAVQAALDEAHERLEALASARSEVDQVERAVERSVGQSPSPDPTTQPPTG